MTHKTKESSLKSALNRLGDLAEVENIDNMIRIES